MALGNKQVMARNIQKYLDKLGIDRKKLCDDLGLKYTTVAEWLQGGAYPRIDKIELMANYFGCSKADLVEESSSDLDDLTRMYNTMNEKQKQRILEYARLIRNLKGGDDS